MIFFSAILFYLVIIPISLLPFPVLYGLSDVTFFILYYVFPYRKKIVMQNLRSSFPEKPDDELKRIRRKFYHHFCDLIFESLKVFTASEKAILKRVNVVNPELLESYYRRGKSLVLATGHYANWEWTAVTLPFHSSHTGTGILVQKFHPVSFLRIRRTLIVDKTICAKFVLMILKKSSHLFCRHQLHAKPGSCLPQFQIKKFIGEF